MDKTNITLFFIPLKKLTNETITIDVPQKEDMP